VRLSVFLTRRRHVDYGRLAAVTCCRCGWRSIKRPRR